MSGPTVTDLPPSRAERENATRFPIVVLARIGQIWGEAAARDSRRGQWAHPSPGIAAVLVALHTLGPSHGQTLARAAGASQGTVSGYNLPKLERFGLVTRGEAIPGAGGNGGGRPAQMWHLTASGRELAQLLAEHGLPQGPHDSECRCAECVVAFVGVTYRQLDYWTRRGWLRPEPRKKETTGVPRVWPWPELHVARLMARLVAAGINPGVAHRAARSDGQLAPGVRVVLEEAS